MNNIWYLDPGEQMFFVPESEFDYDQHSKQVLTCYVIKTNGELEGVNIWKNLLESQTATG